MSDKKNICTYFLRGKCRYGAGCKDLHEYPNSNPGNSSQLIANIFLQILVIKVVIVHFSMDMLTDCNI